MSTPLFQRINEVCDRFEEQWKTGQPPKMMDFMEGWEGAERRELYRFLLELDLDYRRMSGKVADANEYNKNFPEYDDVVAQVFGSAADVLETLEGPSEIKSSASGLPATEKLLGHYQIIETLGKGGMGAVYLAHDSRLDRKVAIKVPFVEMGDSQAIVDRFIREARALAAIVHPNICPIHEVSEEGDVPFMVMTFVQGKPLSEPEVRPTEIAEIVDLIRKLAFALHHTHQVGVVHRDLKPSNIVINYLHEPVILDFGLATLERRDSMDITVQGAILGTPAYMSPEQVQGKTSEIGPRTDIYTLGVMFYELLAGQRPFSGDIYDVMRQVVEVEPAPPSSIRPEIPPEIDTICAKAMAKSIDRRYSRMVEFAEALDAWLQDDRLSRLGSDTRKTTPRGKTMVSGGTHGTDTASRRTIARTKTQPLTGRNFFVPASKEGGNDPDLTDDFPAVAQDEPASPAYFPDNYGYQLIELIGKGQYGEVWLANAPGDIQVAVKKVLFPTGHKATQAEMRALELVKCLVHPLLLNVQAYWIMGDQLMIVSELADGSLEDKLKEHDGVGVPREKLLRYMSEAAEAIDYLHAEDIYHRDIKPANILLQKEHVKVADFGIAVSGELEPGKLTVTANALGTPLYMAPEVWDKQVGPRSDQYSLAVTFVELRLGKEPKFDKENRVILDDLPVEERTILGKALAPDPADRYESCTQFIDAFYEFDEQQREKERRKLLQRRALIGTAVAAVVGTPMVMGFQHWRTQQRAFAAIPDGFRLAANAVLVPAGPMMLYDKIERPIDDGSVIPFVLIPETNQVDLRSFYCMQDMVSNEQFAKFVAQDDAGTISENWQTGPLAGNDNLPAASHPQLPVSRVTSAEAYAFAQWIGCDLPTKTQWEKAAGRWDSPEEYQGPFRIPANGDPPAVAVNRIETGPAEIGSSSDDVSIFGCRDMAGNIREWTKSTDHPEVVVPITDLEMQYGVVTCGHDYQDVLPLHFSEMEGNPTYIYELPDQSPDRPFGFRCIVEIP